MSKKICILTTNEENFFTPRLLSKIIPNLRNNLSCIIYVPGFKSYKKTLFFLLLLKFNEIIEIISYKIKNYFKNNFNFPNIKNKIIKNINSEEAINFFLENKFDLIVTLNCNQIIKQNTLDKINVDFVNFHPGKLPYYKGIFTNFYSLENYEKDICLSFHKIDVGIDTGPLMKEISYKIEKKDTVFKLYKKLFFSSNSHEFIVDCLINYQLYKKTIINKLDTNKFPYKSYPSIKQILKFKLRL